MTYELLYTPTAAADIGKLDPVSKKRLRKTLEKFQERPLYHARKMINSSLGDYRFRVSDHRVIFDLDGQRIIVLRVGHRREIYR